MWKDLPFRMGKDPPSKTKEKGRTEGNVTLPLFTLLENQLRNFTLEKKLEIPFGKSI